MMHDSFTLGEYKELLMTAIEKNYEFIGFDQINKGSSPYNCILRHDVDTELLSCLPMIEIERSCNVKATYFLMLRSTAYNLLCIESKEIIQEIIQSGHHIGLHFMNEYYNDNSPQSVIENILNEKSVMENELGLKISSVSFHQPSQEILNSQILIPNMVNTYRTIDMGDFFYTSDTNMTWRTHHPMDIFSKRLHPNLQLLIHPIWWTENSIPIEDKWRDALLFNNNMIVQHWMKRERSLSHHSYSVDFNIQKLD
jgi:hypothetical protein